MSDPTVVRGDRHDISWTIDTDLTGATVALLLAPSGGGAVVSIAGSVNGTAASFPWADQVPPGIYNAEIEITKGDEIITAPTERPSTLRVREDLNPA